MAQTGHTGLPMVREYIHLHAERGGRGRAVSPPRCTETSQNKQYVHNVADGAHLGPSRLDVQRRRRPSDALSALSLSTRDCTTKEEQARYVAR